MPPEEIGYDIPAAEGPTLFVRGIRLLRYGFLLLLVPLGIIFFRPPYEEQEQANQRIAELSLQRDAFQDKVKRMQRKLDLIKNDDDYLETMARDRLRLQKDGELVLRFEE